MQIKSKRKVSRIILCVAAAITCVSGVAYAILCSQSKDVQSSYDIKYKVIETLLEYSYGSLEAGVQIDNTAEEDSEPIFYKFTLSSNKEGTKKQFIEEYDSEVKNICMWTVTSEDVCTLEVYDIEMDKWTTQEDVEEPITVTPWDLVYNLDYYEQIEDGSMLDIDCYVFSYVGDSESIGHSYDEIYVSKETFLPIAVMSYVVQDERNITSLYILNWDNTPIDILK